MVGRGIVGSVLVLLGGAGEAGTSLPGLLGVLTGLLLWVTAWADLLHRSHLAAELGPAPVVRCVLAWSAPLVPAPPLFSRDGWAYAAQGALSAVGLSPYEHGPAALGGPLAAAVDPRWADAPAPYGPLPLAYGALLAHVTRDPLLLVAGHRLAALVGLALLARSVPRLAGVTGVFPAPATAVVAASPLVIVVGVGGPHNDLFMVGLASAGLVAAVERHWLAGAVLVGLAGAVKAPGLLFGIGVALLTLPRGARLTARLARLAGVAAVAVAVLVATGALTGLGLGWVHALGVPGSAPTQLSPLRLVDGPLRVAVQLVPIAAAAAVAGRGPVGDAAPALRALGLVLLLAAVLGSATRLWYLLWPLPCLAVVPLPGAARRLLLAASGALALAVPLTAVPAGDTIAYAALPGLGALTALCLLVSPALRDRMLTARPIG